MAGGQQLTASQGTLNPERTVVLSAESTFGTFTQGLLKAEQRGQQLGSALGFLTADRSVALSGVIANYALGQVGREISQITLNGLDITSAVGTLVAASDDVTVNISGIEATFSQDSITVLGQVLTGILLTGQIGIVERGTTVPITGVEGQFEQGIVSAVQEADDTFIQSSIGNVSTQVVVALSGVVATVEQGNVAITGDVVVDLSGVLATLEIGNVAPAASRDLVGVGSVTAVNSLGAPGHAALTGVEGICLLGNVFTTNDRSYALTGVGAVFEAGLAVTSSLAFLIGQEGQLQQQGIGPRTVALIGVGGSFQQGVIGLPAPPVEERPANLEWIIAKPSKPKKRKERKTYAQELDEILEEVGEPGLTVGTGTEGPAADKKVEEYVKKELEDEDEDEALLLASL